MIVRTLTIFFFLLCIKARAQMPLYFNRVDTVKIKSGSSYLRNPWVGGLNNPQFSEIDLNFDGIKDLFVFDRSGYKVSTYLNQGTALTLDYTYAPEYRNAFPTMNDWTFLVDYNCDGKEDIFTYYNNGSMSVYRNDGDAINGLKFTLVKNQLVSDYLTDTLPITLSAVSLPTIVDIDGDGDLDVLNFRSSSIYMEYHKNRSVELYGNCDSLDFKLTANCWGYFSENSISNDVNLNDTCSDNISNKDSRHAGSTLLAIDLDGDNDKDLLVGDLSFTNMVMLTNGGNNQDAYMSAQESNFPSYSSAINVTVFPAAFYLDVNNDGAKDLLVSPNASNISENANSVWYYKNSGTTSIPHFELEKKNLFQDEMIEVGEGAYPVFFDYNSDGLLDLVVGNYGYYTNTGSYQSGLALLENIGTLSQPEFKLVSTDYAGIISLNLQNVIPAFGDMDSDGDADLLIGNKDGALHYFKNSGGVGNTANFSLTEPFYEGIDVGNFSAPFIMDINKDGKLDLIIGEQNGNLNYFENSGTTSAASFTTNNSFWGQVDVRQDGSILGYSIPCILNTNGETHLLVGSESGDVYHYANIDNNTSGIFTVKDTSLANIYEGIRTAVAAADINNDGFIDVVMGNYGGGISLFYGSNTASIQKLSSNISGIKKLYPNPVNEILSIELNGQSTFNYIELFDQMGRLVYQFNLHDEKNIQVNTKQFSEGLYTIVIYGKREYEYAKFIISH